MVLGVFPVLHKQLGWSRAQAPGAQADSARGLPWQAGAQGGPAHAHTHLSSARLATCSPSWLKHTERTQRSLAPPAKMGVGGGNRCLWTETGTAQGHSQHSTDLGASARAAELSTDKQTEFNQLTLRSGAGLTA